MLAAGLALAASGPAPADELGVRNTARGITVHDAETTLRDFCSQDADGTWWFALPGGARFELVSSIDDPVIVNRGDGAFHPFEASEVRAALAATRYPLDAIRADVFILPYPRRNGLTSAAGPGIVLLSPGVRPLSRTHQHAEVVHELGHVVQYALMPDSDHGRWTQYRDLRDIEDAEVYAASSVHADRPHEIFAEDFRALFGGDLATSSGGIENPRLVEPTNVGGLARFMLMLGGIADAAPRLAAYPNPARGPLKFSRATGADAPIDLFDVSGRHVATVEPTRSAVGVEWAWDGRDRSGRRAGGAAVFARVRGSGEPALRVALLP